MSESASSESSVTCMAVLGGKRGDPGGTLHYCGLPEDASCPHDHFKVYLLHGEHDDLAVCGTAGHSFVPPTEATESAGARYVAVCNGLCGLDVNSPNRDCPIHGERPESVTTVSAPEGDAEARIEAARLALDEAAFNVRAADALSLRGGTLTPSAVAYVKARERFAEAVAEKAREDARREADEMLRLTFAYVDAIAASVAYDAIPNAQHNRDVSDRLKAKSAGIWTKIKARAALAATTPSTQDGGQDGGLPASAARERSAGRTSVNEGGTE